MKKLLPTLAGIVFIGSMSLSCEKESNKPVDCATGGPSVTLATTKASCGNSSGSLQTTGSGGKQPYQYSIDGTTFQTNNSFASLAAGSYTVTIKDADGCLSTATTAVEVDPSSISYDSVVKNIIATNCSIASCHVAGGTAPGNFSQFSALQSRAAAIKTRTGNKSMPVGRSLTNEQIQQIACWVDAGAPNN